MIASIADQTNLLALNATIEAARAGEAGRGFAVVAQEVKALATQTGKATEEIDRQVTAIREASIQMVKAVHDITQTIGNINGITTSIAGAVEQQNAATAQISETWSAPRAAPSRSPRSVSEMPKAAAEIRSTSPSAWTRWRTILRRTPTACSARSIRCLPNWRRERRSTADATRNEKPPAVRPGATGQTRGQA